jgi:hypothetical protein
MERFQPVIGALIRLDVLAWGEDGMLEPGVAEIFEVEDRLREALLAPVPADAGVRSAAMPEPPAKTPPERRAGKVKKPTGKKPPGTS